MEKQTLSSGIKFIYEYRPGNITSFCIGFEAGALMEQNCSFGIAHAVEHMLFKGTKHKSEFEINKLCDELFGFNNAMTNYPYAIYYGTTLSTDFEAGFHLYADILLNPSFPEEGFKEEINIICEELKEWKDDLVQYCEDELLYNSFEKRRIRELIIGNDQSVRAIQLRDIKEFYNKFYCPENCVITVASSLGKNEILNIVRNAFDKWERTYSERYMEEYESNKGGTYIKNREGINGAKIQYIYPIHELSERELNILSVFNLSFGEGTSSLLFDLVRTRAGLTYDISSSIKKEKGIMLFTINLSTSVENIDAAIKLINAAINSVKTEKGFLSPEKINKNLKTLKLKRELLLEKSIILCKELTTYELMFDSAERFYEDIEEMSGVTEEEVINLARKVLVNPSIQIIKS